MPAVTISLADPAIYTNNASKPTDGELLRADLNTIISQVNTNASDVFGMLNSNTSVAALWTFLNGISTNTIAERTATSGVTIDGLIVKDAGVTFTDAGILTIATGVVTATGSYHTIDTEAAAATDDLDTINGGVAGRELFVQAENDARTVVLKHNTGNIFSPSAADISLDDDKKIVHLVYSAALSKWIVTNTPAPSLLISALTKTANYTAVLADRSALVVATANTWTLSLDAAATLGAGWYIDFKNEGTGNITIDPNGAETINGVASIIAGPGTNVRIYTNGTSFRTTGSLRFTSAAQTITAAGSLTIAHGLGIRPMLVQQILKNTTAEFNYSIGDEVEMSCVQMARNASVGLGVSCVPDATNLNIRFGSDPNTYLIPNKTTGNFQSITNASWNVIFKAFA